MIRRIRGRFIRIALAALALSMVLVTAVVNLVNLTNVRSELYETLSTICASVDRPSQGRGTGKGGRNRHMQNMLSESQYFTVSIRPDGELDLADHTDREAEDESELLALARQAVDSGKETGRIGQYLYRMDKPSDRAVFLNIETRLTAVKRLALFSLLSCVGGILLAWLLVSLLSRRAIRPLIENAVMQKQFITDAGHELKTPLTVMSANMDILSQDIGPNEWVRGTQKQIAGMRRLVEELVYLSRMDEEDFRLVLRPVDLTSALRDIAEPYIAMSEFGGRTFEVDIAEGLTVVGDEASLRRLISVLCDNAFKHSPEGTPIRLCAVRTSRTVTIETENLSRASIPNEDLPRLFERFYRPDKARSRESGGFGIGLALARAIAERHGGTISVCRGAPENSLRFLVTLKAA